MGVDWTKKEEGGRLSGQQGCSGPRGTWLLVLKLERNTSKTESQLVRRMRNQQEAVTER